MRLRVVFSLAIISGAVVTAACVGDEPATPLNDAGGNGENDGGASDGSASGDGPATCDAPKTQCTSGCTDTSGDKKNCGACGHDCFGGDCNAGVCAVAKMFTGTADASTGGVQAIAVDSKGVYWATPVVPDPSDPVKNSTLFGCAFGADCSVPDVVFNFPEMDSLAAPASQPGTLYFTESTNDNVLRTATSSTANDGGTGGTNCSSGGSPCLFMNANPNAAATLTADSTFLYSCGNFRNMSTGMCDAIRLADAGVTSLGTSTGIGPTSIALDPADSAHSFVYIGTHAGTVEAFGSTGGVGSQGLATGLAPVNNLVVAHSLVFYSDVAQGKIFTLAPCVSVACMSNQTGTLFATAAGAEALTADAKNLYFTANGNVMSCPLTGCGAAPVMLAAGTVRARAITNDATSVYWGDDLGSVYRLAK